MTTHLSRRARKNWFAVATAAVALAFVPAMGCDDDDTSEAREEIEDELGDAADEVRDEIDDAS